MSFIDSRGRLFGRFNLVDLAALLFVIVLVPMGYIAYRVFRIPPIEIGEATPRLLTSEMPPRLQLRGRHFRPYLTAFVGKNGEPFAITAKSSLDNMQGTFLIVTPDEVEIALPPTLDAGTYDLHLFDEAQEVATLTRAFTVQPLPRATLEAAVRFFVLPDTVPLIKEGDRDRWEQGGRIMLTPAECATLGPVRVTNDHVALTLAKVVVPTMTVETTVRIPAKARALGGWEDKSDWLRAGEALIFETDRYRIYGVIDRLTETATAPPASGGK